MGTGKGKTGSWSFDDETNRLTIFSVENLSFGADFDLSDVQHISFGSDVTKIESMFNSSSDLVFDNLKMVDFRTKKAIKISCSFRDLPNLTDAFFATTQPIRANDSFCRLPEFKMLSCESKNAFDILKNEHKTYNSFENCPKFNCLLLNKEKYAVKAMPKGEGLTSDIFCNLYVKIKNIKKDEYFCTVCYPMTPLESSPGKNRDQTAYIIEKDGKATIDVFDEKFDEKNVNNQALKTAIKTFQKQHEPTKFWWKNNWRKVVIAVIGTVVVVERGVDYYQVEKLTNKELENDKVYQKLLKDRDDATNAQNILVEEEAKAEANVNKAVQEIENYKENTKKAVRERRKQKR